MKIAQSNIIAKMKYVVQCYISDRTGKVVRIDDYKSEQDLWALEYAYTQACEYYGNILPVPDNGKYEMFTV